MSEVSIYHNPRCSKSRQTLQLLEQHDIQPEIIDYLNNPPSVKDIRELLHQLGFVSARELMRSKETIYKEMDLASVTDENELLAAMAAHPKLIERPVVICNNRARLGRPPEAVLDILP
ncbi:arsenate reductase (glutaredoxin) [Pseudidiomarina sp.]|uniref:arsenate reductase (glutaredoxin) n=1 Tax=Pseudidiomarina sp. TaxID=2081707 RepID=UPI00299D5C99|nr:arsenate reductase (glutaredoxin) [Pseudidiomarina sp.]MDX1705705.1 arsenate reductase (glutaredoxin) [Pseudidiomarina sp.]